MKIPVDCGHVCGYSLDMGKMNAAKWQNDGERNDASWLGDEEAPLATVSPEWRSTRGAGIGRPDRWVARDASGNRIGDAPTRSAAQKLVVL